MLGIACALPAVVFWMKAGQEPAGLACGLALLAAGITGAAVSFRRDCSGRSLLFSGCFHGSGMFFIYPISWNTPTKKLVN